MTVVYRFIVLCVLSLSASLAATAQQVELSAPGAEEELVAALRANSLLLRDNEETVPTSQDIVASARADYRRLMATLYQYGHFSPVVRITLDGR